MCVFRLEQKSFKNSKTSINCVESDILGLLWINGHRILTYVDATLLFSPPMVLVACRTTGQKLLVDTFFSDWLYPGLEIKAV